MFRKIKQIIRALKNVIRTEYNRMSVRQNPQLLIAALRKKGLDISEKAIIRGENIEIDQTRPSLVHIGDYTLLHKGFTLLTHDFATRVFMRKYNEFIPSSGKVWIGNNVWFGENVTVLKGSHIGDNCIIGINSVVMGEIPQNSVAAGCPAKVICSLDEYFEKRKEKSVEEAFEYARSIVERYGRRPVPEDFWEEFPLFISGENLCDYPQVPVKQQIEIGGVISRSGSGSISHVMIPLMNS